MPAAERADRPVCTPGVMPARRRPCGHPRHGDALVLVCARAWCRRGAQRREAEESIPRAILLELLARPTLLRKVRSGDLEQGGAHGEEEGLVAAEERGPGRCDSLFLRELPPLLVRDKNCAMPPEPLAPAALRNRGGGPFRGILAPNELPPRRRPARRPRRRVFAEAKESRPAACRPRRARGRRHHRRGARDDAGDRDVGDAARRDRRPRRALPARHPGRARRVRDDRRGDDGDHRHPLRARVAGAAGRGGAHGAGAPRRDAVDPRRRVRGARALRQRPPPLAVARLPRDRGGDRRLRHRAHGVAPAPVALLPRVDAEPRHADHVHDGRAPARAASPRSRAAPAGTATWRTPSPSSCAAGPALARAAVTSPSRAEEYRAGGALRLGALAARRPPMRSPSRSATLRITERQGAHARDTPPFRARARATRPVAEVLVTNAATSSSG